jgi:hypothetical protein
MRFRVRTRVLLFLALAMLVGANESGPNGKTLAYFTATAVDAGNTISTVSLSISAPSSQGVFNIASNMIPGDYQIQSINIVNGISGAGGVPQKDFTYSLVNTSSGVSNHCSLLDSSPPCGTPNPPSADPGTGAALLLVRCTASGVAAPCSTSGVLITQVYPLAGAGTSVAMPAGLAGSTAATVAAANITLNSTSFTGGQLLIGSDYHMGGLSPVLSGDQSTGLVAGATDNLAAIVYLPSSAGNTLADQTSTLTFTWTARQRVGGAR